MLIAALLSLAHPAPDMAMWRLDCGTFLVNNLGGKGPRTLSNGCYLIRHGGSYMLWDAGLPGSLVGNPDVSEAQTLSLDKSIADQLAVIGVRPDQVTYVGISHSHGDHVGQAADFPRATLMIGRADFATLASSGQEYIGPWLSGAPVMQIDRDHDVFGDGRVTIVTTPGHTPGHTSLLVRLAGGSYLLTGDLYHFASQIAAGEVSGNATDPAAARASMVRFQQIARETGATIIVQHEPGDIAKLPLFPASAS